VRVQTWETLPMPNLVKNLLRGYTRPVATFRNEEAVAYSFLVV